MGPGRGFGRWLGPWGPPGWGFGPWPGWFASKGDEKEWLRERAAWLREELEAVERRMKEVAPEGES